MDIQHLPNWAASAGRRSIELYKSPIVTKKSTHRPILFLGGVHGDEPEGVRLAKDLLRWLQQQDQTQLQPWALIPCLNPDGYESQQRTNANGVDLNRNYPASNWSADCDKPRYFPGASPGSETEIQALCKLIEQIQPQLIIHFHSWQPCIVLTGPPAIVHAELLSTSSGYPLQDNIGYPTPGSLSQYGWVDNNIPVICTEEQEHSSLDKTWSHFGPGLIKILNLKIN